MAASSKIGVGIVGVNPNRGFASIPAIDVVTVSVKVPDHYPPAMAAIEAGKRVYCEWPLGRNTDEAVQMLDAAERKGIRHMVGLQGQMSPAINYAKDLIAEGYVGRVLSATMIACAPNWGASIDRAYQADRANGANLLTITSGHTIDVLCYCLGEFRELAAFVVSQRDRIPLEATGEIVAKTAPDQLVVNGIIGDGAVVSFQVGGGMRRGTEFLFEIHGEKGDLQLAATAQASMQRQELILKGAQGDAIALDQLPVPGEYRWVPEGVPSGSPYNVAQLFRRLAEGIRDRKSVRPGFDAAVTRHRLLDSILQASDTGMKQVVLRI
jgi:predicted dehydrogenase